MVADWILASVLGSALTLAASLATLLVKDLNDRKQKDRERVTKQMDNTMSNVYSPLYFFLYDVGTNLATLSGLLKNLAKDSLSKEDEDALFRILRRESESLDSYSIRKLLVDRIGFVRPNKFRVDLFQFFQSLSRFEDALNEFAKDGFGSDITSDKKWIKKMYQVAERFCEITIMLEGFLDKLMNEGEKATLDSEYDTLIPTEDFKQMLEMIYFK